MHLSEMNIERKSWDWQQIFSTEENQESKKYEEYWNRINTYLEELLEQDFSVIRFFSDSSSRFILLTRDVEPVLEYRLTYFDEYGPVMHENYSSNEKELEELYRVIANYSGKQIQAEMYGLEEKFEDEFFVSLNLCVTDYTGYEDDEIER